MLSTIGYNYEEYELSNMSDKLEPYKNEILKSILTYFKEEIIDCPYTHDNDHKISIINRVIKTLKLFGINWSELDAIEKSVNANKGSI